MKKLTGLFAVGSALLIAGVVQAQPMATTVAPAGGAPATTVTTETTTSTDTGAASSNPEATGTMPTTGGAPIAMALTGIIAASGAFFARRKLA